MNDYNITSAEYQTDYDGNNRSVKVVIDGETLAVPMDSNNRHYAAVLKWVADGNTIQDAS